MPEVEQSAMHAPTHAGSSGPKPLGKRWLLAGGVAAFTALASVLIATRSPTRRISPNVVTFQLGLFETEPASGTAGAAHWNFYTAQLITSNNSPRTIALEFFGLETKTEQGWTRPAARLIRP